MTLLLIPVSFLVFMMGMGITLLPVVRRSMLVGVA